MKRKHFSNKDATIHISQLSLGGFLFDWLSRSFDRRSFDRLAGLQSVMKADGCKCDRPRFEDAHRISNILPSTDTNGEKQ